MNASGSRESTTSCALRSSVRFNQTNVSTSQLPKKPVPPVRKILALRIGSKKLGFTVSAFCRMNSKSRRAIFMLLLADEVFRKTLITRGAFHPAKTQRAPSLLGLLLECNEFFLAHFSYQ